MLGSSWELLWLAACIHSPRYLQHTDIHIVYLSEVNNLFMSRGGESNEEKHKLAIDYVYSTLGSVACLEKFSVQK